MAIYCLGVSCFTLLNEIVVIHSILIFKFVLSYGIIMIQLLYFFPIAMLVIFLELIAIHILWQIFNLPFMPFSGLCIIQ